MIEGQTVLVVLGCFIAAVLIWALVTKRLNLPKVSVSHEHTLGLEPSAVKVADKAFKTADRAVDKAAEAIEHVADAARDIAVPVTEGAGEILEAIGGRIRTKQKELSALHAENASLVQEVERLRARMIDVSETRAQLKLGLLEIDQQYHSFRCETIKYEKETFATREAETEYLGLIRARYKLQVGVDIDALRFALLENERIAVYGLDSPEIIGFRELQLDELLSEVRQSYGKGTFSSKECAVLLEDSRNKMYSSKHQKTVLDEIQQKQSVGHLASTNAKFALAFLQACFGPAGYRLEIGDQSAAADTTIPFVDLVNVLNDRVNNRLSAAVKRQVVIEAQCSSVEREIVTLALEGPTSA